MYTLKEKELTDKLFIEIGIFHDANGIIVDQDTRLVLNLNGKTLFYPYGGLVRPSKEFTIFTPLRDLHLMRRIFSYYITKLQEIDGKYYPIMFTTQEGNKTSITIKDDNCREYTTRFYSNLILAHYELIFLISGEFIEDLITLDSEEWKKK